MWGQAKCERKSLDFFGIIPTRVGTRKREEEKTNGNEDHPHACGDKKLEIIDVTDSKGSSPRVWGQDNNRDACSLSTRIIPTRVGTSRAGRKRQLLGEDHPHACGDKSCIQHAPIVDLGSSPRVWGQGLKRRLQNASVRIIPTRVGTSCRV